MSTSILAIFGLGAGEMLAIGAVALLLFGRKLPDVARSMGQSIVAFKHGLKDAQDDYNASGGDGIQKTLTDVKEELNEVKKQVRE